LQKTGDLIVMNVHDFIEGQKTRRHVNQPTA
jgi:hypothetical protein